MNGVLPARPLRVDESALAKETRRVYLLVLLFVVVGGGFAAGAILFASSHLEHRRIWNQGVPGTIVDIDGAVTESGPLGIKIFYDYKVGLRYLDQSNREHHSDIEFSLFWSDADPDRPAELRYLAAEPGRATISTAVSSGPLAHFGMPALMSILSLAMFFGVGSVLRSHGQKRRALFSVVQDGEELWVEISNVTVYQGTHTVRFRMPDSDADLVDQLAKPPLLVFRDQVKCGVVLRSPRDPRVWVLMRQDLTPLALSDEEKAATYRRIAEGDEGRTSP